MSSKKQEITMEEYNDDNEVKSDDDNVIESKLPELDDKTINETSSYIYKVTENIDESHIVDITEERLNGLFDTYVKFWYNALKEVDIKTQTEEISKGVITLLKFSNIAEREIWGGLGSINRFNFNKKIGGTFGALGWLTSKDMGKNLEFMVFENEDIVKKFNLQPIARMVSCHVAGVDPLYMGIGPCAAIPKALKTAGLKLDDIDQIELNEAFAAQALAVIQQAGLDPEKVNVNGGAIALGHPLGCTGAKLTTQILEEMRVRNQKYGMVTACVGGGQGIAGIFERF